MNHIYKLNRDGVIVDVQTGIGLGTDMKCPEPELSESDLADIVAKERARRSDLPPPFEKSRTRVSRMRCLYLYFEYQLPEKPGDFPLSLQKAERFRNARFPPRRQLAA